MYSTNWLRLFLAMAFGLGETIYFGNHFFPSSDAEIICDGIALLMAVLSIERRQAGDIATKARIAAEDRAGEAEKRKTEAHANLAAAFTALCEISQLTDLKGEVDDYSAVVAAVKSLRADRTNALEHVRAVDEENFSLKGRLRAAEKERDFQRNAHNMAQDALRRQGEELGSDAKRYQWAKDILSGEDTPRADAKAILLAAALVQGQDIDAAIDANIPA